MREGGREGVGGGVCVGEGGRVRAACIVPLLIAPGQFSRVSWNGIDSEEDKPCGSRLIDLRVYRQASDIDCLPYLWAARGQRGHCSKSVPATGSGLILI